MYAGAHEYQYLCIYDINSFSTVVYDRRFVKGIISNNFEEDITHLLD